MVGRARLLALTTCVLPAVLVAAANAQVLARLHVRSMLLSAEPQRVRPHENLRIVFRARVDERIARLDNVTLPDLSGFDVLGDERRCAALRQATECTETLTLAAAAPGIHTIGAFSLDAIDARDGRPKRFGSNSISVVVAPAAFAPRSGLVAVLTVALRLLALGAFVVLAAAAVALLLRRRSLPVTAAAPAPQTMEPAPSEDGAAVWRALVERLRAYPSRADVEALRANLRRRVGARPNETFGDLAARGAQLEEPSAMEALRLLERAAFIGDSAFPSAVRGALPALDSLAGMHRAGDA